MNQVSVHANQNATIKRHKIHLSQSTIAGKVIAFKEFRDLKERKYSERKAANIWRCSPFRSLSGQVLEVTRVIYKRLLGRKKRLIA